MEYQDSPFIRYLVPVVKESKLMSSRTNRKFFDAMWNNLNEVGLPCGGIELTLKKEGFHLDQATVCLGKVDTQVAVAEHGFKKVKPKDEVWHSHSPGLFKKFVGLAIDRSKRAYTKEQVEGDINSLTYVSKKVKTQAIKFANKVIENGHKVLCLGMPVSWNPFGNKIKVYCLPKTHKKGAVYYSDVVSFAKEMGCSENLEILSDLYDLEDAQTRYISFDIDNKGVKNKIGVEVCSEHTDFCFSIVDWLKVKNFTNESHSIKSPNGFHHLKLTFSKGRITPKLYFSIGYERFKAQQPKVVNSNTGRPVNISKSQN